MKNCVYRFLDKDNNIIYIGKAQDLKNRLNGHNHLPKECYSKKARVEYISFSSMDEADIAERYLISKIKPKYNATFKSKEININIDTFDRLQWLDYSSKSNVTLDFETRKKIVKIDLDIEKINAEIKLGEDKKAKIQLRKAKILDSNGKGNPIVVHINKNTRYHVYDDDELCNDLNKANRNSEGLDEYADLYEKWWDEEDKVSEMLKRVECLKNKKIDLLLRLNKKRCNKDIKAIYVKYDSVDDEFIINSQIKLIEEDYKKKLVDDIFNYGYYDYNKFIQDIDYKFKYNKYLHDDSWLRLIKNIESPNIAKKYADDVIRNIEDYIEGLFGNFILDTIVKDSIGFFSSRMLPTAYVIKKPVNS